MEDSPATVFKCRPFYELSLDQLYAIMTLRQVVFVVEQDCPYLDADGKDQDAHHLLGYQNTELVAYARLMPPGLSYPNYAAIGRVVTKSSVRGTGTGRQLMRKSMEWVKKLYNDPPIKISAQCYLTEFYQSMGFVAIGSSYLEDGIPHVAMVKEVP